MKSFIRNYLWIILIILSIILYPIFDNIYMQGGCCAVVILSMIYGGYMGINNKY